MSDMKTRDISKNFPWELGTFLCQQSAIIMTIVIIVIRNVFASNIRDKLGFLEFYQG